MDVRLLPALLMLLFVVVNCKRESKNRGKIRDTLRNRQERENKESTCELSVSCHGETMDDSVPVRLPIRGPKGSPGLNGMKGEMGEKGIPGLPGFPGTDAPIQEKVAFFAGLKENQGPTSGDIDIKFDSVVTNVGGAYDPNTGHFTAPYNGTYQFTAVIAAQGRQKAAVMLMKNGLMIVTVWAESIPFWATASNNAILQLKRGDEVWLLLLSRAPYLHGFMYSTFSGYLLFKA